MKRVFALLLCFFICLSLLPISVFADEQYTVTFVTAYGTAVNQVVDENSCAQEVVPVGNTGDHCFRGWLLDGVKYDFTTPVTADITLTADWKEHTNPKTTTDSCTVGETVLLTCSVCGEEFSKELPARGHDLETEEAQAPTCTETGWEAYEYCTREGCGYTTKVEISALGHHYVEVAAQEPSCYEPGWNVYVKCDRDNCNNKIGYVEREATGEHSFNDQNICTTDGCDAVRATVAVTVNGSGTARIGTSAVESGVETVVEAGNVSIDLIPSSGYQLSEIQVNSQPREDLTVPFTIPVEAGTACVQVSATFTAVPESSAARDNAEEAKPEIDDIADVYDGGNTGKGSVSVICADGRTLQYVKSATVPGSNATPTDLGDETTLSNLTSGGTYYFRYKASEEDGLSASDWVPAVVEEYYTVVFQNRYGSGTYSVTGASKYKGQDHVYAVKSGDDISVTFTPAANYRLSLVTVNGENVGSGYVTAPLGINDINSKTEVTYGFTSATAAGTTVVVDPAAAAYYDITAKPTVTSISHVYDRGETATGSVKLATNGRDLEYVKSSSTPGSSTPGIDMNGATRLSNLAAGGDYYFRYKASPAESLPASAWVKASVTEYYTVRMELIRGKGSYEVTGASHYDNQTNVYEVVAGGNMTVTFKPASHYWLYEINVNGEYVGSANVKTTYKTGAINKKTVISYGFSASSSSPKTGDLNDVSLWIAEEIVSLLGMTTIVWYLFRRKETY